MNTAVNSAGTGNFEFDALRAARNYRQALIREFSPHLSRQVIEVGAGIGQVTEQLASIPGVEQVLAVEPDPNFCRQFRERLPGHPLLEGTVDALGTNHSTNAIVSVNVLEHIEQDEKELATYARLLKKEAGTICLFVPARPEIYAPLDRDFGHYRRYTRPELRTKLKRAGFEITHLNYFNFIGYFAWWFSFCLLRQRRFQESSVRLFDRVIFPPMHAVESKLIRPPFGQSLLAIARIPR